MKYGHVEDFSATVGFWGIWMNVLPIMMTIGSEWWLNEI